MHFSVLIGVERPKTLYSLDTGFEYLHFCALRRTGLSVMASELYYLTGSASYNSYLQRWLANILGANSWIPASAGMTALE